MKRKPIVGISVSTPYPRPDWNQTDETKPDYIKNKPDIKVSYPYKEVDLSTESAIVSLEPNTFTYAYGVSGVSIEDELHFALVDNELPDDEAEEVVLILDFRYIEAIPTIILSANQIKWLNGEPPTIEAGKCYMFSFVKIGSGIYLGIGGEYA